MIRSPPASALVPARGLLPAELLLPDWGFTPAELVPLVLLPLPIWRPIAAPLLLAVLLPAFPPSAAVLLLGAHRARADCICSRTDVKGSAKTTESISTTSICSAVKGGSSDVTGCGSSSSFHGFLCAKQFRHNLQARVVLAQPL